MVKERRASVYSTFGNSRSTTQNPKLTIWNKLAIRASQHTTELHSEELVKRSTFMLISTLKVGACLIWGTMFYAADENKLAVMVPFVYFFLTLGNLFVAVSEHLYEKFVFFQLTLILVFPYIVEYALGGYFNSGAVMLWSFLSPLGAAFFRSASESIHWFQVYLLITVCVMLHEYTQEMMPRITTCYFTMNMLGVLSIVYFAATFFAAQLEKEYKRSEYLLHNILPPPIANRIKKGENPIIDKHGKVSILFADIVGFTTKAASMNPQLLIAILEEFFSKVDQIVATRHLTKIKTIGDCYMIAGGLKKDGPVDHAKEMLACATDMFQALDSVNDDIGSQFEIRIGIHVGPVIAGVLGTQQFAYDVWGDAVNTASRMESHGKPSAIHLSEAAYEEVKHLTAEYDFTCDGESFIKGKGKMVTYYASPHTLDSCHSTSKNEEKKQEMMDIDVSSICRIAQKHPNLTSSHEKMTPPLLRANAA